MEDNREDVEKNFGEVEIIPPKGKEKTPSLEAYRDKLRRGERLGDWAPTPTESRLLEVMLDPYHRMASVSRQCELAGISRASFYRIFKNPNFVAFYREALLDNLRAQSAQLVNIGVREARKGSFPHWKVLMEMAGLHADRRIMEQEGSVSIKVSFVDPDED